ncbi:putative dienelactone hydrolase, alpha/Beta hydrolase [Helianthus annuus]|uniref:Dienelactone hydrolase, alpha/Beta hydrolase n=1 Tax=Helianthus annuus TaxID=4232 RepID=A0A251S7V2_HELAN|nr:endo-1,3;1,4-beta-D-glucanase isoform X1 [Helianthus annuus]KAF5763864.1 putative dienelactone hydrolase, alpha/Beta hydrolase [Helianthus annuus]
MLGAECCANPPAMNSGFGKGSVEEIGGLKSYITGDRTSNRAILLASDAFGYEGVMLRKIADKISGLGYLVLVPDFFFGDCIYSTSPPEVRANWLNNHSPEKGCENARKIIGELKSKGVCSVGAAGFCWGGMMVVKLAKYNDIKAAVILHPGRLTDNDVKEVKVPTAILGGELDQLCPQEEVKRYGKILSENQDVESFVKIFKGVGHGWASRYSEDDESAARSAEEAHTDMLNWLTKYVT